MVVKYVVETKFRIFNYGQHLKDKAEEKFNYLSIEKNVPVELFIRIENAFSTMKILVKKANTLSTPDAFAPFEDLENLKLDI